MTKRIFRSICLVALMVFLASLTLILGVLYGYFNSVQQSQLKTQTELAAQGIFLGGAAYFEDLEPGKSRVTWIDANGTVLYDTTTDSETMENHASREEVTQALDTGWGESVRYSSTLTERMLYYARRLPDGTVVRLAMAQSTVLNLVLGIAQPMLMVFAIAVALSLALASRLSKKIVEPLNYLDLDEPMSNEGYDEIAPLLRRIDSQQGQLRIQSADLRRKQEELEAVTGSMREGLVLLGSQDAILSINPAAARLLETNADCLGKDILTVNRSPEIQMVLRKAHLGQQGEAKMTISGRDYRLDASPVTSDGAVTGVVLLLVDVTEKERAEQMRREFTANVSHELKTPLHAISGYAELMAGGLVREEDIRKFAGSIYSDAQRMIRLVEDILKLSQLDEGSVALRWMRTDLYALAAQEVKSLEATAQETGITVSLTGEQTELCGIPQLLSCVVHNLCDNAIKYNRPGGKVTVRVAQEGQEAVLSVSDTGIGIPRDSQSRIFERFYRVDKSRSKAVGGTGLGLSIVKHAVLIHNGKIELQSAPGAGTTITARFPKEKDL